MENYFFRIVVLLFLPISLTLAQEDELEPLEVRGRVYPESGEGMIVFDRQVLEESPRIHLDDLLRSSPSFSAYRRSGSGISHPTTQGVSLGGVGTSAASRSLVLLDGIPLSDPFGGWIKWNRYSPAALEVVSFGSPSPFSYSAKTINLQSRRRHESPQGFLGLAAGDVLGVSLAGFSATAENEEGWEASGSFRLEDFAGHPVIRFSQRGAIDEDAWSRMKAARATASRLSSFGRFTASFAGFDERRGNGTPLARNWSDGFDWSLGLENESFRSYVFGQERSFSSVFPKVDINRSSEIVVLDQFAVPASSLGFVHEHSLDAGEHELGLALTALRREGHTNEDHYFSGSRRNAGGRQTQIGISLSDSWSPAENWNLLADLKGEWFRDDRGTREGWKTSNGSFPARENFDVGGSLKVSRNLSETINAYFSFRTGVRRPTLNELYRDYRVGDFSVSSNASLSTERATGIELGLDSRVADDFSVSLGLFHDQIKGSVANVSNPAIGQENNATRRNLDHARVRGIEISSNWSLSNELSVRVQGLFMDPTVRSCTANPGLVGKRFAQVPERRATASLLWRPSPWELRLDARHESDRFDDTRNSRLLDPFLALDLAITRKFSKNARIHIAVQNLSDEEIQSRKSPDGLVYLGEPRHWTVACEWFF